MPWEHCNQTLADTDPCPACSVTKQQWTTSTFEVATQALDVMSRLDVTGGLVRLKKFSPVNQRLLRDAFLTPPS